MKTIRKGLFETNSSSTHALVIAGSHETDQDRYVVDGLRHYIRKGTMRISLYDVEGETRFMSPYEKLRYLVTVWMCNRFGSTEFSEDPVTIEAVYSENEWQDFVKKFCAKFNETAEKCKSDIRISDVSLEPSLRKFDDEGKRIKACDRHELVYGLDSRCHDLYAFSDWKLWNLDKSFLKVYSEDPSSGKKPEKCEKSIFDVVADPSLMIRIYEG